MEASRIIDISQYREIEREKPKRRKRPRKKGSVKIRGNKLWVDFPYLGERVREPSGLDNTSYNRKLLRRKLDLIMAEIDNGLFEFAKRFPKSNHREHFAELEGRDVIIDPNEISFAQYVKKWWREMSPGLSTNQIRDYSCTLNCHLLKEFGPVPFSEFRPIRMKKYLAKLKAYRRNNDKPLSAKRIQNIFIPLRVIVRDAIAEYGWTDFPDPFFNLKMPKIKKTRVQPFRFQEWQVFRKLLPEWYRNFFDFAVQTGLRPSEQVALKWSAIDEEFIHIELSRVRNLEKEELKNEYSRRQIQLRPAMLEVLERQWEQTKHFESPYVFLTPIGTPIIQDRLREHWKRAMDKSGLHYRRMYETRHTFASWALGAGELPEWVARTLGHADTSMVYRTYGRYIPNLTRQDGSAFEKQYVEMTQKKWGTIRHNLRHNRDKSPQNPA
ncbi:Arm DNA-binding domain-containing protein [uncultured Desulfosarcina sp.]|uniref:Arm DNA-binding domain-containing protein n=1 Tax=uncultured Desulfosarcina sp. TaxID=218289 RepID=UPI0029C85C67|nr:DUF3596 domain-containing protein [uncultured Desulfosarcina sp.]